MCLAIPGEVLSIEENPSGMTMGTVSFGGIRKQVCLAYVPDARPGDYVIVHVGFALSKIDESEAREVFRTIEAMDRAELEQELGEAPSPPAPTKD